MKETVMSLLNVWCRFYNFDWILDWTRSIKILDKISLDRRLILKLFLAEKKPYWCGICNKQFDKVFNLVNSATWCELSLIFITSISLQSNWFQGLAISRILNSHFFHQRKAEELKCSKKFYTLIKRKRNWNEIKKSLI